MFGCVDTESWLVICAEFMQKFAVWHVMTRVLEPVELEWGGGQYVGPQCCEREGLPPNNSNIHAVSLKWAVSCKWVFI